MRIPPSEPQRCMRPPLLAKEVLSAAKAKNVHRDDGHADRKVARDTQVWADWHRQLRQIHKCSQPPQSLKHNGGGGRSPYTQPQVPKTEVPAAGFMALPAGKEMLALKTSCREPEHEHPTTPSLHPEHLHERVPTL